MKFVSKRRRLAPAAASFPEKIINIIISVWYMGFAFSIGAITNICMIIVMDLLPLGLHKIIDYIRDRLDEPDGRDILAWPMRLVDTMFAVACIQIMMLLPLLIVIGLAKLIFFSW